MGDLFRRGAATFVAGFVGATLAATLAWSSVAQAQSEPPGRVGRLAFTNGTVSFHDNEQSEWAPAVVNTPLSTGDSLWTEPNARSEISLAGTRIRMAGATELDMLAVDDTQTRLQVDQGRIDVKTQAMDPSQPYQIATPRGTISLLQQGDYYVEAGSTEDPTQIGVRSGAAQIQGLNGQVLAVRAGEVGEVTGDAATPQLRTIHTAPPALPASWADRDRQVSYDQPPQYLTAGVTGYEDLNQYGTWVDDSSYGKVWIPRSVPSGWAPYRTGHWAYEQPWGWTWIDDQPWGFAPYHYGRWANREGRWMWLPPQRNVRPVYAPALVAFVGGVELSAALSRQSSAPVGWFPLGPREAYVPPYTTNRDYYQRINRPARVEDQVLNERWQRAERHEPAAGQNQQHAALMNQRFATVVPATAFVHSQPVARAALQVAPDKIAAATVAPVAAPPAPTASVAAAKAEAAPNAAKPSATPAPGDQSRDREDRRRRHADLRPARRPPGTGRARPEVRRHAAHSARHRHEQAGLAGARAAPRRGPSRAEGRCHAGTVSAREARRAAEAAAGRAAAARCAGRRAQSSAGTGAATASQARAAEACRGSAAAGSAATAGPTPAAATGEPAAASGRTAAAAGGPAATAATSAGASGARPCRAAAAATASSCPAAAAAAGASAASRAAAPAASPRPTAASSGAAAAAAAARGEEVGG